MRQEIFTSAERELIRLVLNRLLPAEDPWPAAGDLGGVEYFERRAVDSPAVRRTILAAVREIDILAGHGRRKGFAALTGAEQDAVLGDTERRHPGLFEAFLNHAFHAYYSHPTVVQLLGIDGPPQPRGHPLIPFDNDLTETVRRRGPIYRQP